MVAQMMKCLLASGLACCLSASAWAQAPSLSAEQVSAAAWSQEQIQARIRELEAERAVRLALMSPDERLSLLDDPQIWLIALSVMLVVSFICLSWLLWLMRRAKNQQWQISMVMDWDSEHTRQTQLPITITPLSRLELGNVTEVLDVDTVVLPDLTQDIDTELQVIFEGRESIEVQEHSDPIAHAEFWLALKKPEIAIEILETVCENDTTPKSGMMLFKLYHQTQHRAQYEDLKRRFKTLFNTKVPDWEELEDCETQYRLRDMPDLMHRINQVLHKHGVHQFLKNLLIDNRGGTRQGFEYGVFCDLVNLFETVQAGKPIVNCESIFA